MQTNRCRPIDRLAALSGRLLVIGAAIAALLWVVHLLQFVVLTVVLGLAQVAVLRPLVEWLHRHRLPRPLAALAAVGAVGAVIAVPVAAAVHEVIRSAPAMSSAAQRALAILDSAPGGVRARGGALLSRLGDALGAGVLQGASFLGSVLTVLAASVVFALFALVSGPSLWRSMVTLVPSDRRACVRAAGAEALRATGAWFYASGVVGLVDGLAIGLGMALMRLPLAGTVALLTFLLSYVPMVGAVLAGIVAVAIAFAFGGPGAALVVAVIVLLVQQAEGHLLSPLLMSRAARIHPIVLLLTTMTTSTLLGVVGMILTVPVVGATAAAITAYRANDGQRALSGTTRWFW